MRKTFIDLDTMPAAGPAPPDQPRPGRPAVHFSCSTNRFMTKYFANQFALGDSLYNPPAACPDAILKNSKASLSV